MARKAVRLPERHSPKHRVLRFTQDADGKPAGLLDCGHTLTGRTVWPGKMRWCPICDPPRATQAAK